MLTGTCHCGTIGWTFDGMPESVTACNCTLCRRYGALWAYGYEGEKIKLTGPASAYTRAGATKPTHELLFCPKCGCASAHRDIHPDENGRRRIAFNLRLTDPGPIANLAIDHFEGLDTFEDLPRDGRCVRDMWF